MSILQQQWSVTEACHVASTATAWQSNWIASMSCNVAMLLEKCLDNCARAWTYFLVPSSLQECCMLSTPHCSPTQLIKILSTNYYVTVFLRDSCCQNQAFMFKFGKDECRQCQQCRALVFSGKCAPGKMKLNPRIAFRDSVHNSQPHWISWTFPDLKISLTTFCTLKVGTLGVHSTLAAPQRLNARCAPSSCLPWTIQFLSCTRWQYSVASLTEDQPEAPV